MAISIKDLAQIAGVSISTVTRALANKPDVNKKTRQLILDLAEKHHYRPNILARSLVTSKTYAIGVIVPDLTNPFFPALIKGIESTLWKAGYSVILADTNSDPMKESQIIDEFISRRVDGLIISPVDTRYNHESLEQIRRANLPVVSLTRTEHQDADTVIASDRSGARMAVDHLLHLGRNKIVYIGNESSPWANSEREAGLREGFAHAGLAFDEATIQQASENTIEAARQTTLDVARSGIEFNAVVAFDDYMALGVRAALTELGKRVPQDVALVGFDNIELSALPEIDLTTIDIPKLELGRVSAQTVVERIDEAAARDGDASLQASPRKEIVLNTRLIIRGSTQGSE